MSEDLGLLIRERREALGLDQATLAAHLDVGQQAVSGWENGRSRPRRSMLDSVARTLSVDLDLLLDAGGYRSPALAVRLPVRPLTRALPLDELTEERFEDLLTEVVATLHLDGHASRYGGRGHKQYGIDILVTADGINLAIGQCKRHREFGPSAVRRAIKEVTIFAPQNYLFLSRLVATPAARAEAGRHANWELWDGEDISRHIRNLPREQAVRIVDNYFPGHRESFLGISAPGPWLPPEEHFGVNRGAVFNHDWNLVGRRAELDQLVAAAYQANATVAFLVGAGGVGKTRVLKAVADARPAGTQIRLLPGNVNVTGADLELLPVDRDLTVIIDDAHEIVDIANIMAGIWRRNPNTKVLLATRPYGVRGVKEELARHGLLPMPHTEVVIGDLEFDEAFALAREALGEAGAPAVARRLAALTIDSPLVTVVGGVLIRQGHLDPTAVAQDDNVRLQILRGFRDALVKDPLAYDPPTRMAVLDAVAALQPFRTNEEDARTSLSAVVGKPYDELHKHLRSLENAGILRRRGDALRIVPDLLGDVILTDAVFDDRDPLGTGYLARIESIICGNSVEHLFVNVSRVDWQIRNLRDDVPSLADSLWAAFRSRVVAADAFDRRTLAETLAKVAYFQPTRALQLTRWLIDNPTDRLDGEHAAWRSVLPVDYNGVLEVLPAAIQLAALTEETLSEAAGQLWALAQGDIRPTNSHANHPLRVLCELAEFSVDKPIWFNDLIIDSVSTWFADGNQLSPFEVLEPMLATEGDESSFRGHSITFRPFALNPSGIMKVRQRVIDLAFEELDHSDVRRSGAAAKALKSALQLPTGRFGREVSEDELAGWIPGILLTINRLHAKAAAGDLDPAVLVAVRDALFWYDSYGSGPLHEAAQHAIESIPDDVESLLGLMVHDGWGRLVRDRGDNFEAMEAKRLALIAKVTELLQFYSDEDVVDVLVTRLRADREVFGPAEGFPDPVLQSLVDSRPALAHAIVERVRNTSEASDLDSVLPVVLGTFATRDPDGALLDIRSLLVNTSLDRRRSASQAIGWNRGLRELSLGELDLLLELSTDADVVIRRNVVRAAQLLARTQKAEAIRILTRVRFGDSQVLADDYFISFRIDSGISWDDFSETELDLIRRDLVAVNDIGTYSVTKALAERSETAPEWVVGLLKERIELAEAVDSLRSYRAIPYSWDNGLRIRSTSAFLTILSGILSWIAERLDSWRRRTLGADLFSAAAGDYDDRVLGLLARAISGGVESWVGAVAAVLHEAPRTLIWDQTEFVRSALHSAEKVGKDACQQVVEALRSATISGTRTGSLGEPFPETIEQRDRSRAVAMDLPAGSVERKFYVNLAQSAEIDARRETEDDLPTDGRDW
ncbi:helix-turn-helix domain-containing protein [Tersicoccus sp. MR15.9]|uniref:helix-turn-helix domain-containing protein n=1 Tax=Tersicoccus mangrovi TaxID=3121635 RepID=UPI002FE55844